jgi:probable rRNA maturation factor
MPLVVTFTNQQKCVRVDPKPLRKVVRQIVRQSGIHYGNISLAVVDDATIAALHNQFLGDPRPTDVLSFVLESSPDYLEGEVIASAETAARIAPEYDWPAATELHLYLLHGVLHLVGYDDQTPRQKAIMRKKENFYLEQIGIARGKSG